MTTGCGGSRSPSGWDASRAGADTRMASLTLSPSTSSWRSLWFRLVIRPMQGVRHSPDQVKWKGCCAGWHRMSGPKVSQEVAMPVEVTDQIISLRESEQIVD